MTDNPKGQGTAGQQGLTDTNNQFNAFSSIVEQALGRISTVKLVKVVAVSNDGGISAVGTVDVLPLVNLMDGLGKTSKQVTVFGLPYFRLQGGKNAIIIDPVVGDIGFAVIADRDISAVKSSKDQANPGSFRRFSLSDGVYIGGILNDVPEQYIQFKDGDINAKGKNIKIEADTKLTLKAPDIEIEGATKNTGAFDVEGALGATGTITAGVGGADLVTLQNHRHTGNNLPPVPGL